MESNSVSRLDPSFRKGLVLPSDLSGKLPKETLFDYAALRGSDQIFHYFKQAIQKDKSLMKDWSGRDARGTPLLIHLSTLQNKIPSKRIAYSRIIEDLIELYPEQLRMKDTAYLGDQRTALHQAVADGNLWLTELYLKHKAPVNEVNQFGESPLHFAARFARPKLAALLIRAGAHKELRTKFTKSTPMMLAAESRSKGVMKVLLKAKANTKLRDAFGKNAFQRYQEARAQVKVPSKKQRKAQKVAPRNRQG